MRISAMFLSIVALSSVCAAEDPVSVFTNGFAHLQEAPLDQSVRRAAIERVDSEVRDIAKALLGDKIAAGLKLSVKWSDGNTNGFETHFEAKQSLVEALGERIGALHRAYGARYQELIAATHDVGRIKDSSYLPLGEFLKRYEKEG